MKLKKFLGLTIILGGCLGCELIDDITGREPIDLLDAVEIKEVPAAGSPYLRPSEVYNLYDLYYGLNPAMILAGNRDNSFDIAWLDKKSYTINVSTFDAHGNPKSNIIPSFIGETHGFLGFTKVSIDGSFVVGYSKDNEFGDNEFELWIARFDASGCMIFNTRIFGDRPRTEKWSKGSAGMGSSSCIVYNKESKHICCYTGHTMLWDDNKRHQGGYIGFLDLNGNQIMKDTNPRIGYNWFVSHNFDQRLMVVDGMYYALAHGDGYPRALVFSAWEDGADGTSLFEAEYFPISGSIGDNITNTQTGGFVSLNDGNFGVIFTSSVGRTKRDVCFEKLDKSGNILVTKWLTENDSSDAVYPRIALRGDRVLVAWDDLTKTGANPYFMELQLNGEILVNKTILQNVVLPPRIDWITLPNGDIIWAVDSDEQKFKIFRIKG